MQALSADMLLDVEKGRIRHVYSKRCRHVGTLMYYSGMGRFGSKARSCERKRHMQLQHYYLILPLKHEEKLRREGAYVVNFVFHLCVQSQRPCARV